MTLFSAVASAVRGDTRESRFQEERAFADVAQASAAFEQAQSRLLDPNDWKMLGPRFGAADFQLIDAGTTRPKKGLPEEGDFLKIDLPDPGPAVWVGIEEIDLGQDRARVVVRPTADPTRSNPTRIAHLFGEETTNVFEVQREDNTVTAKVTSLNETRNTTGNFVQDAVAAGRLVGAWVGLKKPRWNAFTNNLLDGPR